MSDQEFFEDCENGALDQVRKGLARGADPNTKAANFGSSPRATCLIAAAHFGHEDVVALLLQQPGIKVNLTDDTGLTALHVALERNHGGVSKLLLNHHGLDFNSKETGTAWDNLGPELAFHNAVKNSSKEVVALLMEKLGIGKESSSGGETASDADVPNKQPMIDINTKGLGCSEERAIHYAAGYNSEEVLALLLLHPEIDVNARDTHGQTALHTAAEQNKVNAVRLLLKHPGVDISAVNSLGDTVLHYAAGFDHEESWLFNSAVGHDTGHNTEELVALLLEQH